MKQNRFLKIITYQAEIIVETMKLSRGLIEKGLVLRGELSETRSYLSGKCSVEFTVFKLH